MKGGKSNSKQFLLEGKKRSTHDQKLSRAEEREERLWLVTCARSKTLLSQKRRSHVSCSRYKREKDGKEKKNRRENQPRRGRRTDLSMAEPKSETERNNTMSEKKEKETTGTISTRKGKGGGRGTSPQPKSRGKPPFQ